MAHDFTSVGTISLAVRKVLIWGANKNAARRSKGENTMGRILRKEECRLQLLQVVREIPEVRQDRVDELRDRIGQGRYTVDADALAERMLEEALAEALRKKSRKPRH